jgi:Cu/Ag efflux pump CusA
MMQFLDSIISKVLVAIIVIIIIIIIAVSLSKEGLDVLPDASNMIYGVVPKSVASTFSVPRGRAF